ncbi:kinase-like domain-containing protein [Biscogniauxia sp. FL1348]|nr:kinase-like domain-containing protein [Biscogniauxia sp. FL1348]
MPRPSEDPTGGSTGNPTAKIKEILRQLDFEEATISSQLELGYSDFWIPIPPQARPIKLSPSQSAHWKDIESPFLDKRFLIQSPDEWPGNHFNLSRGTISKDSGYPNGFEYVSTIGHGNYSQVEEIRDPGIKHFVTLVASYTDEQHIGMVLSPVAECNLGQFLDRFNDKAGRRDEGLLGGFFGCLATALAYLHYSEKIRHKDIKPANILVKGNNIYLSDFGIAFDWSEIGVTTTRDEQRKTTKYCSPELYKLKPRNSKSDIWSLGCVFLEMITVLKGKSTNYIYEESELRSFVALCRAKDVVIKGVISMLRKETSQYGNEPLVWIEKMLQLKADKRPNALELREEILHSGRKHCGICCFRKNILKDNRVDAASSSQRPPTYAAEPFAAKVYVPSAVDWLDVTLAHSNEISSNWISPELVNRANLQLDKTALESIMLEGRRLNSTQCTKLTWTVENAKRTMQDVFLVAPESMAVDMIIPSTKFDTMRQSVSTT